MDPYRKRFDLYKHGLTLCIIHEPSHITVIFTLHYITVNIFKSIYANIYAILRSKRNTVNIYSEIYTALGLP